MKYFSQRRYSYIPYPQLMDFPDDPYGKSATVRSGGCGLCSACMMVDQLTLQPFSVRECAQLSMDCGANHDDGTDMEIFGPVLAEKFNLEYYPTNDVALAAEELRNGGRVILLVGGDRDVDPELLMAQLDLLFYRWEGALPVGDWMIRQTVENLPEDWLHLQGANDQLFYQGEGFLNAVVHFSIEKAE